MKIITLKVRDQKVTTIIQALIGEFEELHITDAPKSEGETAARRGVPSRQINRLSNGKQASDVVSELLSKAPRQTLSISVIQERLQELGFSQNTAGPTLSKLKAAGKVRRLDLLNWQLADA